MFRSTQGPSRRWGGSGVVCYVVSCVNKDVMLRLHHIKSQQVTMIRVQRQVVQCIMDL